MVCADHVARARGGVFCRKMRQPLLATLFVVRVGLREDPKSCAFPIETVALFTLIADGIQFGDNIFSALRLGLIKGEALQWVFLAYSPRQHAVLGALPAGARESFSDVGVFMPVVEFRLIAFGRYA